jgi:hypothetical protein
VENTNYEVPHYVKHFSLALPPPPPYVNTHALKKEHHSATEVTAMDINLIQRLEIDFYFILQQRPDRFWEPTQPPIKWVRGALSLGGKAAGA